MSHHITRLPIAVIGGTDGEIEVGFHAIEHPEGWEFTIASSAYVTLGEDGTEIKEPLNLDEDDRGAVLEWLRENWTP